MPTQRRSSGSPGSSGRCSTRAACHVTALTSAQRAGSSAPAETHPTRAQREPARVALDARVRREEALDGPEAQELAPQAHPRLDPVRPAHLERALGLVQRRAERSSGQPLPERERGLLAQLGPARGRDLERDVGGVVEGPPGHGRTT